MAVMTTAGLYAAPRRPSIRCTRKRPSALRASSCTLPPKSWAPKPLPIPNVRTITTQDVVAVAPQCAGMSLENIRKRIDSEQMKSRYIQGIQLYDMAVRGEVSDVEMMNADVFLPTHVLRVSSHGNFDGPVFTFAAHGIHLGTHFSRLPADVVGPWPQPPGTTHAVDLQVPSPETFHVLRDYMYSHSVSHLMASLLPPTDKPHSYDSLIAAAHRIHSVYTNATCLGMQDETFWRCIQLSWRATTKALQQLD